MVSVLNGSRIYQKNKRRSARLCRMDYTSNKEFKDIRASCRASCQFHGKSGNGSCSYDLNEVFKFVLEGKMSLNNNCPKRKYFFCEASTCQKTIYWSLLNDLGYNAFDKKQ